MWTKDQREKPGFPGADIMNRMLRHPQTHEECGSNDSPPYDQPYPGAEGGSEMASDEVTGCWSGNTVGKGDGGRGGGEGKADQHVGTQMPARGFGRPGEVRGLVQEQGLENRWNVHQRRSPATAGWPTKEEAGKRQENGKIGLPLHFRLGRELKNSTALPCRQRYAASPTYEPCDLARLTTQCLRLFIRRAGREQYPPHWNAVRKSAWKPFTTYRPVICLLLLTVADQETEAPKREGI